jgi:glutathione S-transferase
MESATGLRSIPTLVDGDALVHGADAIVAYLDERYEEPTDARRHRAQMRAEWPHWVELEGAG